MHVIDVNKFSSERRISAIIAPTASQRILAI